MLTRGKTMSFSTHDFFCGLGGNSEGASQVKGIEIQYAVNHDPSAIKNHSLNFPSAKHDCIDIRKIRAKRYEKADIGLFSPECRCHSPASGKKAQDLTNVQLTLFEDEALHEQLVEEQKREESRLTMVQVLRMVELYDYQAIVVENVCELMKWHYYPQWKKQLENLGYEYQEICFNAQFAEVVGGHTPVASSRDRLYVIAWKRSLGKRPNLELQPAGYCGFCGKEVRCRQRPKRQNREFWLNAPPALAALKDDAWKGCLGKYKQNYLYFCECCDRPVEPYIVPAAFVIDWTIPAQTIGDRCKKLSPQTLERIAKGIERFGGETAFITSLYGTGTARSVEKPLGAITTSGAHHGLALSPFLVQYYGRNDASSSINSPVPTLTGAPRHALVIPPPMNTSFIVEYYSKGRVRNLCEPLGGLTTKERFGLVVKPETDQTPSIFDYRYRMLSVSETAGAMGFPCTRLGATKDYTIVGSNAVKHRLVGQAVCPPVMRSIVERLVDLLSSQI
jgi:DNA (cytosine-5)-methyltransferase 1